MVYLWPMPIPSIRRKAPAPWSPEYWRAYSEQVARAGTVARTPERCGRILVRASREIMRAYTTSFFLASRFLPRRARHDVELIYAAVRYPDEIVDNFPWTVERKRDALGAWRSDYARAMACADEREALRAGLPP